MSWDPRYRRLSEGEMIRADDEVLTDTDKGWQITNPRCVGTPAPSPLYTAHRIYRRRRRSEVSS
ncbi:hypothetical protein ACSSVZ_000562 [Amorphus sp. MBR-141]